MLGERNESIKKDQQQDVLQMRTREDGKEVWRDVSSIENSHGISKQSTSAIPDADRKDLPMSTKILLSPNARIKAHRKANYLYRHSHDKIDTNLLIFLHGAGDTHIPYYNLAKKMNIPQCASLSLSASCMDNGFVTLPFDLGHTWFDEMDYTTGRHLHRSNFKLVSSLKRAAEKVSRVLEQLVEQGGWSPERVFLFGYSAGACLAMRICFERAVKGELALGGAICVAGGCCMQKKVGYNEETRNKVNGKPTPILVIAGSQDEKYPLSQLVEDTDAYNALSSKSNENYAEQFTMEGKGHGMINSQAETRVVLEFCSKFMVRRMVAMEGFCEIPSDQFHKE